MLVRLLNLKFRNDDQNFKFAALGPEPRHSSGVAPIHLRERAENIMDSGDNDAPMHFRYY